LEIHFIGAAQTVTGSQHLLLINGKKILLDCGLYQGKRKEAFEINRTFKYSPTEIDALLLSHAHIDHSGKIPGMVKNSFNGPIYTTAATVDLCQIMLRDSAHLQERDIYVVNKIRKKQHKNPFEPLYDFDDVEKAMDQFIGVQYSRAIEVVPGVMATYWDAGHILGSAGILLEINENGKNYRIGFSGDIGRSNMPIIRNPNVLRDLDLLIMESTYGNRLHEVAEEVEEEVARTVKSVVERGGKIIIPSFAVGRTQLLVYVLHKLFDQNRIPVIPIYVDSPLAVEATKVYQTHPECYDRETYRVFIQNNKDPFGFGRLTYIKEVEQSKELNEKDEPCIIISASGMAEGGRVLHHLANNIGNKKNLVLFVGYAAENTLARKIIDGETEVNIFGEPHKVKAEVKSMDYFSAHADQEGLINYLRLNDKNRLKNIFLVHGEQEQALPLREKLLQKGFKKVDFPAPGEKFVI
jgi:metallo-beta-lactamase family protein